MISGAMKTTKTRLLLGPTLLCAVLSACTVRHVVLEPESPVDRLYGRVIADVVTPTVSASQPVLLARIHATAPKDSSIVLLLDDTAGIEVPDQLKRVRALEQPQAAFGVDAGTLCSGMPATPPLMVVCQQGGGSRLEAHSSLAQVRIRRQAFGVDRPDSVILVRASYVLIPPGHDTVFSVATRVTDPNLDLERTRYGVQLSWYTVSTKADAEDNGVRLRSTYLRASFRHVSYGFMPVWLATALGVVWVSTFK